MPTTVRAKVYEAIDKERDFQNARSRPRGPIPPVSAEVLMLNKYAHDAMVSWTTERGDEAALHMVRKIAALAVRCMENHGAPDRPGNELPNPITEMPVPRFDHG